MKAVVVHGPGDIRWEAVPDPELAPGWARVEIKAVGICSSDVPRALKGTAYRYPIVLGHEMAGVVREAGEGVSQEVLGKRVAVAPLIPCERCRWCQRGRYSLCEDYDYLGSRRDGGCAESLVAPSSNLVPLPDNLSFASGALFEPASVAYHALHGKLRQGDSVVVVGAGPIGLLVVQWAQILGAGRVVAIDPVESRLALAEDFGATPVQAHIGGRPLTRWQEELAPQLADVVVIATGSSAAQVEGLRLARKGGRVIYLGVPREAIRFPPDPFQLILRHELQLTGSWNSFSAPYPGQAWDTTRTHLKTGQLHVEPLISAHWPLEAAEEAYRLLDEGPDSAVKVLLTPERP